ncbi:hypothetical protein [Psychrobacillus sp. BM2]|uniref:hypothetical protein n=1 Tax=Psychrobacillus sp. BM2 TaxID=3400421 RepID=UPI003B02129A
MKKNAKYLEQNRKKREQLMDELELISGPLIKFLEVNYNPHTRIVIDFESVKVVTDVLGIPNN